MKKVSHLLIPIVAVVMACVLALTGCAQPMQNCHQQKRHGKERNLSRRAYQKQIKINSRRIQL